MTNSADLHPVRIPGYEGGPLTYRPELLEDPLFWLAHLMCFVLDDEIAELWFGADYEAAEELFHQLREPGSFPAFTVPLIGDHRLHVVYGTYERDTIVHYLVHHPDWDRAEAFAGDEGDGPGQGMSWSELVSAADSSPPGGSTSDPHARLLLLLPAFGDDNVPADAVGRLAEALRARTAVDDVDAVAAHILENQGETGQVRWSDDPGYAVNNGVSSVRNPSNHFALPPERAARVAAALRTGSAG
ncbi:hypothetical protein ACFWNN_01545 [Lentzea sp. NPDC058450]|uniref:hypothetical protein n=1 Tax=Lentzea sp. NPDC058450 TaxID=3346505 RepID=UPI0036496167